MMYAVLIAGVTLWAAAHLLKRLAPGIREPWGEAGKGIVAALLVVSIVLMVVGYRGAAPMQLWDPPAFLTHINNLLMLLAVYLFAASATKTRITAVIRHPQLTGFKAWAVAHLLVNGDLASLILFGGLLAWAVVSVIVINRATPRPAPPPPAPLGREVGAAVGAVVVLFAIGWVHTWLGYWPYAG
jgi:uncharacterized membrane protein